MTLTGGCQDNGKHGGNTCYKSWIYDAFMRHQNKTLDDICREVAILMKESYYQEGPFDITKCSYISEIISKEAYENK